MTPGGSLVTVNAAYCHIVGYSLADLGHMNLADIVHPDDREAHASEVQALLEGEVSTCEIKERYVTKSGAVVAVESALSLTHHPQGTTRDIAVMIPTEPGTRESVPSAANKGWLFDTLSSIGDGVVTVDTEERLVFMNKVAEDLTGWTCQEACGKALIDIFHIVDQSTRAVRVNPVSEVLKKGESAELIQPTLLIGRAGVESLIADSVSPIFDPERRIIGAVLIFRDITQKDRHDQELIKIQKLESVGVLAGGIAHDFNNLLTVIMGNVALAKLLDGDRHLCLAEAESACLRARDLTQQLLTFAKGGAPIKRVCGVANLLQAITTLTLSGSNIRSVLEIAADLWPAEIDAGQIGQVLTNLLLNAQQAMPRGGAITVTAKNATVHAGSAIVARGRCIPAGAYLHITVEDTGCGIPEAVLRRIFDPYFTTKDNGSGLGLSISYAIIQKHGGYLYAHSKVDQGSCFSIYLPAWKGAAQDAQSRSEESNKAVFGSGKVLVMDDEPSILAMAERLLAYLGYEVSVAQDGDAALRLYQAAYHAGAPFCCVLLDITVAAGMGGVECLRKLWDFDPAVRGIISSGYATDPVMSNFSQYGFKGMVVKPYDVNALSVTLRAVTTNRAWDSPEDL